jgi:hypothetical protein
MENPSRDTKQPCEMAVRSSSSSTFRSATRWPVLFTASGLISIASHAAR